MITKHVFKIIMLVPFIVCISNCTAEDKMDKYNKILISSNNEVVKTLEVLNFQTLTENDYRISGSKAYKQKFQYEMMSYKNGDFVTFFEKDINGNNKTDVILSCNKKNKIDVNKNYIVIFEKIGDNYILIAIFELKGFKSFFHSKKTTFKNGFNVFSDWGTDEVVSIVWDGNKYKISK